MIKIIGMETLLHISFSLAAFVFSVVLYILICALGSGQQHKSLKFKTLTITIVIGNLLSILDNIFRDAGIFPTPIFLQLFLLLGVYLGNILLTYYMALYMESFFEDFKLKKIFFKINTFLVISGIVLTVFVYVRQLSFYSGEEVLSSVPIFAKVLFGYVYELYYLLYSVGLFIVFRKSISSRARMTSVAAFVVVIGSVLFELLNTFGVGSGILYNYFGVVLGLYIFYIGVETPDYRNLLQTLTDLDQARRTADEANRSKSDFLANMSHEIRTPINAVLGMNEMILREAEDETILAYSENIGNAGRTLLGLINDILDFSKIEAGKIEIIPTDYDLSSVLTDLVNMISDRAENKGLKLKLDFDRKIPRFLRGDEVRIKQVITNILTNAVKYTNKGSVSFNIGFENTDEPDSVVLNVSIKDTGIGIKPEDLSKLYVEFQRIEEKRNRNIEGTGLGMSITKRLLELMGSSLKVDSTYGVGSTFSFDLKQTVVRWDELGDYESLSMAQHTVHKKYREKFYAPEAKVLIVDDNPMNLLVFKGLIKKTGIKVDTAENGDEGLLRASVDKYDVIFLDHMMPGKDGIETLQELRKESGPNRKTPAICLTANAISGAREQYIKLGFEGYLSKPIDFGELEETLLSYIPKDKVQSVSESNEKQEDAGVPDEFISLNGTSVNVKKGLKNAGDKEDYLAILKEFYDTADERTEELDRYYSEEDYKDYSILVHALKSSARIIGDEDLGNMAEDLEKAGKAENTGFIRENHGSFLKAFHETKEEMAGLFENTGEEDKERPVADADKMKDAYARIKTAAGNYDLDALDAVFKEMEDYSVPEEERSYWEEIRRAYKKIDYGKIEALLDGGRNEQ